MLHVVRRACNTLFVFAVAWSECKFGPLPVVSHPGKNTMVWLDMIFSVLCHVKHLHLAPQRPAFPKEPVFSGTVRIFIIKHYN